jgi:acyl-CoA dehydrogenase
VPETSIEEFTAEARAFLDANATPRPPATEFVWGEGSDEVAVFDERDREAEARDAEAARAWRRQRFDHGFGWIGGPEKFGGRDLPAAYERAYQSVEQGYVTPNMGVFTISLGMVAPTILAHAIPEVQDLYLRDLYRGDLVACQLFSEPGAGSDLATLATRAVLDGDEWVVNGQKVWTSSAQHADFGILVARTDPDVPKHEGLTFFIVDMRTPGIEVRPLVQAQGVAHFNEVFLSDVRIPTANVVGEVGDGWKVTRTTLRSESSMISGAGQATGFAAVLNTARRLGRTDDPIVRQELAKVMTNELIVKWMGWRTQTAVMTGRRELALHGSLLKNFFTRSLAHRVDLAVELEGAEGMLWHDAEGDGFWQYQCLNQFASRIGGGTEEVHRNNLGEQALGLPREPTTDRDVPWNQTVRA